MSNNYDKIPDEVQTVKDALDIVQVIGETIQLTKRGDSYRGAVLSSSKSGASLIVNPRQQVFNDTAGEAGGDVYSWIAFTEGLDPIQDFPKILSIAAEKAGIQLEHHPENPDKAQVLTILQAAAGYYHSQLTDEHRAYIMEQWGISNDTINKLLIGYAPNKTPLELELKDIFHNDDLKKSGLFYADGTILTDVFRGRIMFPYWKGGKVVYFIGRDPEWTKETQHGKYIKQPVHTESRAYISEVIDNNVFYGEDSIKRQDTCMITEGVTDCIMAIQSGVPCISPVTVRIKDSEKEHALELVKRMKTVYVCNDNEDNNAGRDGAIETAEYLESNGIQSELIELPRHAGIDKIDLAEFLSNHDSTALMNLPRNNVWSIKLQAVTVPSDAVGKAQILLKFITSDLAAMDPTMREVFVRNEVRTKFEMEKSDTNKILKRAESELKTIVKLDDRFFDERGSLKVKSMAEYLMSLNRFITLEDTKLLYYYSDGVYIPQGEDLINRAVQTLLGDASKIHHVSEIVHFIKYETIIKRSSINKETCRIPLKNGVYNLETDKLEEHTPDNIFIHQIPVTYDRDAECPNTKKFISEITDPAHPEDIQTIFEYIGYCLVPDTRIQRALMCIGDGSNGKSKLLEAIGAFIGPDNSSSESLQELENDQYSKAELFGKLVNIFPDLASSAIYENSVFKMLVGDEGMIRAVRKLEHPFRFKNTARLIFSANNLPPVPADNFAYMRRWILLEFPHKFEGDDIDINLMVKIVTPEEHSGLLNVVIPALKAIIKNGDYTNIQSTDEINRLYRIHSDPIAMFADECVVYSESDCVKTFMYEYYVNWCKDKGKDPKHAPVFSKRFIKLGYSSSRETTGNRRTVWENCSIRESVRGTNSYPDGNKQYQSTYPSECHSKVELCSIHEEEYKDGKNNSVYSNNREVTMVALTDSDEIGNGGHEKKRQGNDRTPDDALTDGIDTKYLVSVLTNYKNNLHKDGVVRNYEQFALIVYNQSKELHGVVTVEQLEEMSKKLARDGW